MMQTLIIWGRLPGMNEIISADRSHAQVGARLKRETLDMVSLCIRTQRLRPVEKPVVIHYRFYEPNRRRDVGNVLAGADKVIEDALVKCGILPDDGQKWVRNIVPWFGVDKGNPRIEISLQEIEEE